MPRRASDDTLPRLQLPITLTAFMVALEELQLPAEHFVAEIRAQCIGELARLCLNPDYENIGSIDGNKRSIRNQADKVSASLKRLSDDLALSFETSGARGSPCLLDDEGAQALPFPPFLSAEMVWHVARARFLQTCSLEHSQPYPDTAQGPDFGEWLDSTKDNAMQWATIVHHSYQITKYISRGNQAFNNPTPQSIDAILFFDRMWKEIKAMEQEVSRGRAMIYKTVGRKSPGGKPMASGARFVRDVSIYYLRQCGAATYQLDSFIKLTDTLGTASQAPVAQRIQPVADLLLRPQAAIARGISR